MTSRKNICMICLRTDRKLKTIDSVLSDYHEELTDYFLSVINITSPKYCIECEHLLRKAYNIYCICKKSAKTLTKWSKMKVNKTPLKELYLNVPVIQLDMWTPENNKVFHFVYNDSDTPDQEAVVKDEIIEETVHKESIFKREIHCEDNRITSISESVLQNPNNILENTTNIFQNKLTNDNTVSADDSREYSKKNDNPKLDLMGLLLIPNKEKTHYYFDAPNDDSSTKIDDTLKLNEVTPSSSHMNKAKIDMPSLTEASHSNDKLINDTLPITNVTTTFDTRINNNTDNKNESDDPDLVCLDDDQNDVILIEDDEVAYPDDASLNSGDDGDDYLRPPSPKKAKMKLTLDQLAKITLSKNDFDEDYVCDPQKITKRTKKIYSIDKVLATEKNIVRKLDKINESLNDLCENWEVSCLQNIGVPNVTYDDVKKVSNKLLTKENVSGKKHEAKKAVKGVLVRLNNLSSDLDMINEQNAEIIEDYKSGLQDPRERLKAKLNEKFEQWGELKSEDGYIFDKHIVLKCVEWTSVRSVRQLIRLINGASKFTPGIARVLKSIQNKQNDLRYASIFDIQYLSTEEEIIAEFEKRKTYQSYVDAKYKCNACYIGFQYKKLLDYHMGLHDVKAGTYECHICHLRFLNKKGHIKHIHLHSIVYKCKLCPLVTYYRNSMMNHYELHCGTLHQCKICGLSFKCKSAVWKHQNTVHQSGGHVCVYCGGSFVSVLGLQCHMAKKHPGKKPTLPEGEGIRCDKCDLSFSSQEVFDRHEKIHGAPRVRKKQRPRIMNPLKPRKKPIMTCRVCNTIGHSYGWLTSHFSTKHPDADMASLYADKLVFLCDICGKSFSHKYTLSEHIAAHTGVKVSCNICGKAFHNRPALYTHMRIHKPPGFCCERCGKKFRSYANLYNHMRTHIGDRRFKCNVCDKGFLHRCSLNEHIRGVHNHVRRTRRRGVNGTGVHEVTETGVHEFTETGVHEVTETGVLNSDIEILGSEIGLHRVCNDPKIGSNNAAEITLNME